MNTDSNNTYALRPDFDANAAALKQRRNAAQSPFIVAEIGRRLLDRLDLIRLQPKTIWVASGQGASVATALARRYPLANIVAQTCSAAALPVLQVQTKRGVWAALRRKQAKVTWRFEQAEHSPQAGYDLIVANLALDFCASPEAEIALWAGQLNAGGVLLFSTLGAETGLDLMAAANTAGWANPTAAVCVDMHDLGDMLVQARLDTPVMDVERFALTYSGTQAMRDDCRGLWGNLHARRLQGLAGRARFAALRDALSKVAPLQFQVEAAFGHAWRPTAENVAQKNAKNAANGGGKVQTISLESVRAAIIVPVEKSN